MRIQKNKMELLPAEDTAHQTAVGVVKKSLVQLTRILRSSDEIFAEIPRDMLLRVVENFPGRLNMCIARQDHHLDDVIFNI